jgi:hypothetical protein
MIRRAWRWVVFFAVLATLVGAAVTLPIVYNLGQQLRPDQLDAARHRWRAAGPADYDLLLDVLWDRDRTAQRHRALVRRGKVVFASVEARPVERDLLGRSSVRQGARFASGEGEVVLLAPALAATLGLPAGGLGQGTAWDVPALFDHLDALLAEEQAAPRHNFLVASFDRRTGYPLRIVRRVRGTSTRQEWNVYVLPAGDLQKRERP